MGKLSIVVPCYNEEEVLEVTYKRLIEVVQKYQGEYEIVFVNDGSKDKTCNILKEFAKQNFNVKVIDFSRNFGHQVAITAGLDNASGDYIAFIDADLQDPPELILDMVNLMENEQYNVVYGKRRKRDGETFFKKVTAKAYYRFLDSITDIKIPVDTGDFRVIDRKVAEALKSIKEKDRYIRGLVSWLGFKQTGIEFDRKERFAGKTKYSLKKMLKLSSDGIMSFSNKPITFFRSVACFMLFISIALIVLFILLPNCIVSSNVALITDIVIGAIIVFGISTIGEYVYRIYNEVRNRPLYIINEKINF